MEIQPIIYLLLVLIVLYILYRLFKLAFKIFILALIVILIFSIFAGYNLMQDLKEIKNSNQKLILFSANDTIYCGVMSQGKEFIFLDNEELDKIKTNISQNKPLENPKFAFIFDLEKIGKDNVSIDDKTFKKEELLNIIMSNNPRDELMKKLGGLALAGDDQEVRTNLCLAIYLSQAHEKSFYVSAIKNKAVKIYPEKFYFDLFKNIIPFIVD